MEIIVQWVTQIIIFLLLATIIDLLVPATAMKKYIKLVVGLILILIFLKPLFYLFTIDIEHSLKTTINQLYQEEISTDRIENLTKIQKEDIQASQDAYILEQLSTQLKELAKEPLVKGFQTEIYKIGFIFSEEQAISYESLTEVVVYIRKADLEEGAVSIVDEIIILAEESPDEEEETNDETYPIQKLLEEVWEMKDKQLTIKWGGGTS